jgi:hypothetical protein
VLPALASQAHASVPISESIPLISLYSYTNKKSDHYAVLLTLTDNDGGELGHERTTFREDVMENRRVQAEIKEGINIKHGIHIKGGPIRRHGQK